MVPSSEKLAAEACLAAARKNSLFARRIIRPCGYADNQEPSLAELLVDPILHRLMQSDGVHPDHLIDLVIDVKVRLARRAEA